MHFGTKQNSAKSLQYLMPNAHRQSPMQHARRTHTTLKAYTIVTLRKPVQKQNYSVA